MALDNAMFVVIRVLDYVCNNLCLHRDAATRSNAMYSREMEKNSSYRRIMAKARMKLNLNKGVKIRVVENQNSVIGS